MLVLLGFAMIAVFMVLIMTKKLTPVLALIIVPTVFGLFAGAGLGIGDMVMDFIESITMSPMPRPAPAKRPKTVGTMINASTGVNFFVMISTMNTAIMANPSNTSTAGSFFFE